MELHALPARADDEARGGLHGRVNAGLGADAAAVHAQRLDARGLIGPGAWARLVVERHGHQADTAHGGAVLVGAGHLASAALVAAAPPIISGGRCFLASAASTRSANRGGSTSGHCEMAEGLTPIASATAVGVPPSNSIAFALSIPSG